MLGFLFGGALAGLASVAWPIYLHLRRKKNDQIQVVPSLRLFNLDRIQVRKRRLEKWLLLVSRVVFLACLFMLVAQPFLETRQLLSLPAIPGQDAAKVLGVIIDDSLHALHDDGMGNRLDRLRAWLRAQLPRLPDEARVVMTPTSFPFSTPPMKKEEALAYLDDMAPLPVTGKASEALVACADSLRGFNGALLICSGLSAEAWAAPPEPNTATLPAQVKFLDLSAIRTPGLVLQAPARSISRGRVALEVQLRGDPTHLTGRNLRLEGEGVRPVTRTIRAPEALTGRLALDVPEAMDDMILRVVLDEPYSHPWFGYYTDPREQREHGAPAVLIIADQANGQVRDILGSALEAADPEIEVAAVTAGGQNPLPDEHVERIVVVGSSTLSVSLRDVLERLIGAGGRILCIPAADGPGSAASEPRLPGWGPVQVLPGRPQLQGTPDYLTLQQPFEDLLSAGLREIPFKRIREPIFEGSAYPVHQTSGRIPLLSTRMPNRRTSIWALGWILDMREDSPVYHPLFPLFVHRILYPPQGARQQGGRNAMVGKSLALKAWFGDDAEGRLLILPDQREQELPDLREQNYTLAVTQAGRYTLRSPDGDRTRCANVPREHMGKEMVRASFEQQWPDAEVRWLSFDDALTLDHFHFIPLDGGTREACRYDLTHVTLVVVLIALIVETILLIRRRLFLVGGHI